MRVALPPLHYYSTYNVLFLLYCCLFYRTLALSLINMSSSSSSSSRPPTPPAHRGALIVFEGVDRCGKTTQVGRLVARLGQNEKEDTASATAASVVAMRFPDRTTRVGTLIDQYLQSTQELDDRAVHLLFSANRWEASTKMYKHLLDDKTTIVCDRYAYSGVAFSSAKVDPQSGQPLLSMEWCQAPDKGLPAPDCVIFLDISQEDAEQRGGYVIFCERAVSTLYQYI